MEGFGEVLCGKIQRVPPFCIMSCVLFILSAERSEIGVFCIRKWQSVGQVGGQPVCFRIEIGGVVPDFFVGGYFPFAMAVVALYMAMFGRWICVFTADSASHFSFVLGFERRHFDILHYVACPLTEGTGVLR